MWHWLLCQLNQLFPDKRSPGKYLKPVLEYWTICKKSEKGATLKYFCSRLLSVRLLTFPKNLIRIWQMGPGIMYTIAQCGVRKPEPLLFQAGLGGKKKEMRNRTTSTVGGKLNVGQVQFAARPLALIIEQCHGLSLPCLPLAHLSSSRSPQSFLVLTTRSGNTATKVPH